MKTSPVPRRLLGLLILCFLAAGCSSTTTPTASKAAPEQARATLGVEAKPIARPLRKKMGIAEGVKGVLVAEVFPGGPAAVAGIRLNDVVEQIGSSRVANPCEFVRAAYDRSLEPVNVVLQRAGAKIEVTLVPIAQDSFFESTCRDGVVSGCFREAWSLASSRQATDRSRALELYGTACRDGSAEACAYHGMRLLKESDRKSDALAALERSCGLGSGSGCASFAFLHATGKSVPQDDRRAAALYAMSCDLGDAQGCYNAGLMADEGRGVARDLSHALARYDEACEMGSSAACTNLGFLYEHGRGVRKSAMKAVTLYQRGCDGTSCQPSNLNGCVNVGRAYRDGIGVGKDAARSASIFRDACDREIDPDDVGSETNRSRACSLLGALYVAGDGVEKDSSKGLQLSGLGCDRGDAFGCFNAAAVLTSGEGVAPDAAKAASFLKRACDGDDAEGCFDLGIDYEKGRGVAPDRARAATLFRKSCELGFQEACKKLAKR